MTYLSRPRAGKVSSRGGNFGLPLPCHNCRVSNRFTAGGSPPDGTGLRLSNGGTDVLFDDPPFATASLATYRAMVAQFTPRPATASSPGWGDWRVAPRPELLARCPAHDLFQGELGCRLCDPDIAPIG